MPADRTTHRVTDAPLHPLSRRTVLKGAAAGLSASAMLSGASRATPTDPGHSQAPSLRRAQDSITLQVTVWLGDPEFEAMEELAGHFTEAHPNIQIEFVNIIDGGPYGRDQLQRMVAGGEPPDLMMMNTGQFESFGSRGALANLDERIAAENFDLDIYFPAAVDGCRIDGALYGFPKDISNVVFYLNTDQFEAAGVPLPEGDWDWNDFRDLATQLTLDPDGDGNINQWGTSINNFVWSWGGFVVPNGGQILNEDRTECLLTEPESVEALQFYFGLLTEDEVSIPPGTLPQTPEAAEQFLSGVTAMHMAGPWFRPRLVETELFNWTVRLFPRVPGSDTDPSGLLYTDQWAMSADTEYPDEAWELLKFFGGSEGQTLWSEIYGSRSITPIQEVAQSDAWLNYGGEGHRADNELILAQLDRAVPPPTNFGDGAEAENIWNEQFELVMVGQLSVEQAADTICESLSTVLERE